MNSHSMAQPTYQTQPTDSPMWASEPFRVFFPLGILAAVLGAMLWPLFYWGVWTYAPHLQHPRIMMFGFGFAFVNGFLGTAWPRFLEAEALRRFEVLLLVSTWLAAQGCYLTNHLQAGDSVFAAHALALLVVLSCRLRPGKDLPPLGFALAFLAVVIALAVSLIWATHPVDLSPTTWMMSKLFVWQGMLLFPLLGIGSYLFPRFFQMPGVPALMPSARLRFIGVWLTGATITLSLLLEGLGYIRLGNAIRLLAMLIWAALATPAIWKAKATTTRAWGLRMAVGSIAISFLIRSIWPGPGYAIEHLLLIGGFGLALLLVADRVTLGHCAPPGTKPPEKSVFWRWIVWLILLAATTRASADMKASLLISHHVYAALLWAGVVIAWLFQMGPLWRKSPPSKS